MCWTVTTNCISFYRVLDARHFLQQSLSRPPSNDFLPCEPNITSRHNDGRGWGREESVWFIERKPQSNGRKEREERRERERER